MPIIIVSMQDLAGQTIKQQLLKVGNFKETSEKFEGNLIYEERESNAKLVTINPRLIDADHLSRFFTTDLFIFASKHKSESEKPSLLVHAPGNFGADNSYGGRPFELAQTSARVIKQILITLTEKREARKLVYDVTSEVTHHGPTNLSSPCVFIELGSNETFWQDSDGAQVVAETILHVISKPPHITKWKYALGFGGPHYATNFNKIQLHTNYAVSHIAAKYVLDTIQADLILQAKEKTEETVEYAILDWKGMVRPQREKVIAIAEELNLEVLQTRKMVVKR